MAVIPVNRTAANLLRALACETLASRHCLALAARCEAAGHRYADAVLRSTAERRARYAGEHLKMLDRLEDSLECRVAGDTRENLRSAIAGERDEQSALYAGMARTARDEGFDEIADWFTTLAKAGRSRASRFQRNLQSLDVREFAGFGT